MSVFDLDCEACLQRYRENLGDAIQSTGWITHVANVCRNIIWWGKQLPCTLVAYDYGIDMGFVVILLINLLGGADSQRRPTTAIPLVFITWVASCEAFGRVVTPC